ncbi:MAG TPA: glycoside hydrolase family 3 N-terminal domain-containing protein, partial [Ktedonobacteraceae bacterium]|nr:glycoside hydrolase family 3 N-terminal domain-containing protein [Ktedonobacteraceae bacterium]
MASLNPWSHEIDNDDEQDITLQYPAIRNLSRTGTLEQNFMADTLEKPGTMRSETDSMKTPQDSNIYEDNSVDAGPHMAQQVELPVVQDGQGATKPLPVIRDVQEVTKPLPVVQDAQEATRPLPAFQDAQEATRPLPTVSLIGKVSETPRPGQELVPVQAPYRPKPLKRGTALLLIAFLGVIVLHTLTQGPASFLGSQGWASVINGPAMAGNANLIKNIDTHLKQNTQPGTKNSTKAQLTPQQYIDLIVNKMSLDQKLGQMMIVQFTGSTYALPISTMISQYNVGAVLIFPANGNIVSKSQLTGLIKQMKGDTTIPLAVAIDQEGGTVDRLVNLDGPRPAEAMLGASNDPTKAKQAGMQDAKDLSSYGFNLNLAPVVDVTNVYNSQLYDRTYGNTPGLVTKMAAAYLQGLQKSGKVVGTLK